MGETLAVNPPVGLRAAPAYDPPYDDERPPDWPGAGPVQPLFELPPPVAAVRLAGGRERPATPATAPAAPLPTSASPPTTAAAVRFINTCLEIFNGYRAVSHFRALASPLSASTVVEAMTHALRRLRRAAYSPATSAGRESLVKLRQMRTCEPRPGVAEVAVVLGARTGPAPGEDHAWALAFRLESRHGRWLCTAARML